MASKKGKILSLSDLKKILLPLRNDRRTIVFTNGCFDLIHIGHVRYLSKAKEIGDILIVGLNSDDSVRKIKGASRPIIPQGERAEILSALEAVDYVVPFSGSTPIRLIRAIEPDILVKGADWAEKDIVGGAIVKARGGRVVRIRLAMGRSTTNIIDKILKLNATP